MIAIEGCLLDTLAKVLTIFGNSAIIMLITSLDQQEGIL